jgi:hypothetical protein
MSAAPRVPILVLASLAGGICLLACLTFLFSGHSWTEVLPALATSLAWLALVRRNPPLLLPVAFLFFLSLRFHAAWPVLLDRPTAPWALFFGLAALAARWWKPGPIPAIASGLLWSGTVIALPPLLPLFLLGLPYLCRATEDNERALCFSALTPPLLTLAALLLGAGLPADFWEALTIEAIARFLPASRALLLAQPFWVALALLGLFELAQRPTHDLRRTWASLPILGSFACLPFLPPEPFLALFLCAGLPASSLLLARWAFALPGRVLPGLFAAGCLLLAWPILWNGGTP